MTAQIFKNEDAPYLEWVHDHPSGFVLNTRRRRDPSYMVLHRAMCPMVTKPTRVMGKDPFTANAYIKVCAEADADLSAWIKDHGGRSFSKRCQLCKA
jgi:hypothetical protein